MKKKNIIISIFLTIVSIVYTYLVKTYDVKSIGPNNSAIGFSRINNFFRNLIGSHMTIYKITEILGLIAILIVGIYGILGLYQLIKRKSLLNTSDFLKKKKKVKNTVISLWLRNLHTAYVFIRYNTHLYVLAMIIFIYSSI